MGLEIVSPVCNIECIPVFHKYRMNCFIQVGSKTDHSYNSNGPPLGTRTKISTLAGLRRSNSVLSSQAGTDMVPGSDKVCDHFDQIAPGDVGRGHLLQDRSHLSLLGSGATIDRGIGACGTCAISRVSCTKEFRYFLRRPACQGIHRRRV